MSKILALGGKKPRIIVRVWIESENLGGSVGDVDGANDVVVWKGMEGFTVNMSQTRQALRAMISYHYDPPRPLSKLEDTHLAAH